jgi:DNA-binding transcriptional LysR family regulator
MNWDDLLLFLRVAQSPSMNRAARGLGLPVASVARRLDALEEAVGAKLLKRTPRGWSLTAHGEALVARANGVQAQTAAVERFVDEIKNKRLDDLVRVSATEPVVAEMLAPRLPDFLRAHPNVLLELRTANEQVALALNDADVAVRLVRPDTKSLMGKRIATLDMALYGPPDASPVHNSINLEQAAIISYDDSYGRIAERLWVERAGLERHVRARMSSTRGLVSAVAAGAGWAVLPKIFAEPHGLVTIKTDALPPVPAREIWLVWRKDVQQAPAAQAVRAWIETCFASALSRQNA